ncbi:RagB/SusD family nutrient uptake outer membrane protein [Hymenobacter canadensis]|uniref:RagB/SusD family nutrient uptake outer membrane protein n=1 Tax=Hymenobacter canadensis TaxID=2999067 RepID=A0ABY7LLA0_9BACT|nr:RagB/SusD family nutrient uptake outer membrane protein [Hymenobacter canadensis]WBA40231.1 RagB/SusD family nutrient uptake outer membrane protein [Hymenobacter canadensis]
MNKMFIKALLMGGVMATVSGCGYFDVEKLEDPNQPTLVSVLNNATKQQLDYLAAGTFSDMRTNVDGIVWYHQITGAIGREVYVLAGSDARYATNLLGIGTAGFDNNNFLSGRYFTTYSSSRRTARILAASAQNTQSITAEQRNGYLGLAKTAEAYAMLVLSDMQYENGLRIDVTDEQRPGKIRPYDEVLTAIKTLLDGGAADLAAAGTELPFIAPNGFATGLAGGAYNTSAGFLKFNRALAARLAIRRASRTGGNYNEVLTALAGSFINDAGALTIGPRFNYGGTSPDVINPLFQARNFTGSVVTVAHPSFRRDIRATDTRISKIAARTGPLSPPRQGFTSSDDVVLYPTNTSPIPVIKKEELVLLSAEAHLRTGAIATAVTEVNSVGTAYSASRPTPLTAASPVADILDEILYQRRYSLFFEGQRWVDLRRLDQFSRLNAPGSTLPEVSSTGLQTTIVRQLPIPFAEIAWDNANP